MNNPLIVAIDLSAEYHRNYAVTVDKPHEAATMTLASVQKILAAAINENGFRAVICCDSPNNWRKKLDVEYKANREKKPADFFEHLRRVKERLALDGLYVLECDGYEADDVMATVAALAVKNVHPVMIASPDKDILQLVSDSNNVRVLRTHNYEFANNAYVIDKFGVNPQRLGDYLAIVGDTSDNVKGIPGIGGVGASTLLSEYKTLSGVFEDGACKDRFERAKLKRWLGKLQAWAGPTVAERDANIDMIAKSRILVGLKNDIPGVDFAEIIKERKPQSLTTDNEDGEDSADLGFDDVPISKPDPMLKVLGETVRIAVEHAESTVEPRKDEPKPRPTAALGLQQWDENLQPTGMSGLWWFCQRTIDSRMGKFETPDMVLLAVLRGKDFGLSPSASVDIFHMMPQKGGGKKPCPPASLLIARAKSHPKAKYFYCKESTLTTATYVTFNSDNPVETSVTYTIEDARLAGLLEIKPGNQPGNWHLRPREMLAKTAGAQLARQEYPDSGLGAYAFEEME
jgi:5'-3' exonuclease